VAPSQCSAPSLLDLNQALSGSYKGLIRLYKDIKMLKMMLAMTAHSHLSLGARLLDTYLRVHTERSYKAL